MSQSHEPIDCPVAVHRWFPDGEGWSYHPTLDDSKAVPSGMEVGAKRPGGRQGVLMALIQAVKDETSHEGLEEQPSGRVFVKADWNNRGEMLLGVTVSDPDCRDPLARSRHPTITRVVRLPYEPDEPLRCALLEQLRHFDPTRPGPEESLFLQVPYREVILPPKGPASGGTRSHRRAWPAAGAATVIMLLIAVSLTLVLVRPSPEPPPSWAREPAIKMVRQLNGWGVLEVTPTDAEERPQFVFREYFEFLSQRRFAEELKADTSSWQAAFARRLPEELIAERSSSADDEGLRKALIQLANALEVPPSSHVPTLLGNIAVELDYDEWKKEVRALQKSLASLKGVAEQRAKDYSNAQQKLITATEAARHARANLRTALDNHDKAKEEEKEKAAAEEEYASEADDRCERERQDAQEEADEAKRVCETAQKSMGDAEGRLAALLKGVSNIENAREESSHKRIRDFVRRFSKH